jgi:integrase
MRMRLFRESGADARRTAIAKACRAAGVPLFSPHDLGHRRISLQAVRVRDDDADQATVLVVEDLA